MQFLEKSKRYNVLRLGHRADLYVSSNTVDKHPEFFPVEWSRNDNIAKWTAKSCTAAGAIGTPSAHLPSNDMYSWRTTWNILPGHVTEAFVKRSMPLESFESPKYDALIPPGL